MEKYISIWLNQQDSLSANDGQGIFYVTLLFYVDLLMSRPQDVKKGAVEFEILK
ncbi:hypothetical protein [Bacillus sp. CGMCC 1.16541]|uniref:hypothetical protein n=1 Tax=Bacillus sp. CGMCC 1.16541 TaxID=2185143 RepID=UPI0013A59578|nr:hypothetical protein [Bacillus sp. CGMCC 1.16541]